MRERSKWWCWRKAQTGNDTNHSLGKALFVFDQPFIQCVIIIIINQSHHEHQSMSSSTSILTSTSSEVLSPDMIKPKTVTMKMSRFVRITLNHSWRRKDWWWWQGQQHWQYRWQWWQLSHLQSKPLCLSESHGVTNWNQETKKTSEVMLLMTLVCRETWSNLDISQVAIGYNDNDETK